LGGGLGRWPRGRGVATTSMQPFERQCAERKTALCVVAGHSTDDSRGRYNDDCVWHMEVNGVRLAVQCGCKVGMGWG
jgi:hypothetical protein